MRKMIDALAIMVALGSMCLPTYAVCTNAYCAILMDAESGRVLY